MRLCLILSREHASPDNHISLEPDGFAAMVEQVRTVERALGEVNDQLTQHQQASTVFRRSLFVAKDVAKSETFTEDNVCRIRPGDGLAPKHYEEVLGCRATREIPRGTPLAWPLVGPADAE